MIVALFLDPFPIVLSLIVLRSVSDRSFFDRSLDRFSIVLSLIVLRSVSDRPFFDRSLDRFPIVCLCSHDLIVCHVIC